MYMGASCCVARGWGDTNGEVPPGLAAKDATPSQWTSTPVCMLMTSESIPPTQTQGPSGPLMSLLGT